MGPIREIGPAQLKSIRPEDVRSLLFKDFDASIEAGKGAAALVSVVFITGPKAAGRSSLAQRIKLSGSKRVINFVKYLTTDHLSWRSNPEKYELIEKKELEDLRQNGGLVYEGEEQSSFGSATPIALAFKQFNSVQADVKAAKLTYIVEENNESVHSGVEEEDINLAKYTHATFRMHSNI